MKYLVFKNMAELKQKEYFNDMVNALEYQSELIKELSDKLECNQTEKDKLCLIRMGNSITVDR